MRDFTVFDLFVRNARAASKKTAIVAGNQTVTFAELLQLSERLASGLARQGIGQGDRFAVLSMNHPGFFVVLGAAARLGAILVPLNWRLAEDELQYIMQDSGAKMLVADLNHMTAAQKIATAAAVPVVQIAVDAWPEGFLLDNNPQLPFPNSGLPYCIIYTAAVAGKPRGAVLSHDNMINANLQVIASMGLNSTDVNLNMLPLFHITGLNLALAVMHVGGKNVVIEKFTEKETLYYTEQEKVTLWGSFPPILQRMIKAAGESDSDLSSLKYVVGLDGPESIAAFEKTCNARFWILYGQSETSGFVTFSPASDKLGTAGRPGPLSTYILVDDDDNEVAAGKTGEIAVRGPLVFKGYWQQEEANNWTFRNGWHHTGDLAMTDSDGYLVYKGRKPEKELIKPGGENVYPAEVEAAIREHEAIGEVVVIGVPDPEFGEGVKAICELKSGYTLTAKELINFVGSRIARYKKPKYVEFVDALPRKENKVDRFQVKELYGNMKSA